MDTSAAKGPPARDCPSPSEGVLAASMLKFSNLHGWVLKLPSTVFFVVFFVCLWKWIDVSLIYHGGGVVRAFPVFFWGWDFAGETLRYPGGLAEYAAAILAQSLFLSWWGALLLTVQAWIILAVFRRFLKALGTERFALAAFFVPLLLLSVYARYSHLSVQITSLACASVALGCCLMLVTRSRGIRIAGVAVLATIVYAVAPTGLVVFAVAIALLELRQKESWVTALLALVSAALAACALGCLGYGLGFTEAFERVLPIRADSGNVMRLDALALWTLQGLLPLLGVAALLWRVFVVPRIHARAAAAALKPHSTKAKPRTKVAGSGPGPLADKQKLGRKGVLGLEVGCLALAAFGLMYWIHSPEVKGFLQVDYYSWQQQWAKVLATAPGHPRSFYVESAVAQASSHTGDLTQILPRVKSAEDLLLTQEGPRGYWRKSDLYYDLGYVNMALHLLVESGEFWGLRPMILQRLAIVNFALGNMDTARIHLNALLRVPFHGGWARNYLAKLETDPNLQGDAEVSRLRGLMIRTDSVVRLTAEGELLALLSANPQNRLAFEFLMTHYLLAKDLPAFVKNLPRLQGFSGFKLPPLWDEALVLASRSNQSPKLTGIDSSTEAQRRFDAMQQVIRACGDDLELAASKLQDEYGNSYFFHYVFRQ